MLTIRFLVQWLRSGGSEKQLLLVARLLSQAGINCEVHALAPATAHPRIERLIHSAQKSGVKVFRPTRLEQASGVSLVRHFCGLRGKPAVLWTWGARADLIGKGVAKVNRKVKLACSLRSAFEARVKLLEKVARFQHGNVRRYIANSKRNCDLLEQVIPGVAKRCSILYNIIGEAELNEPPVQWGLSQNKLKLVMLGNIRWSVKGYDYVIALAKRISEEKLPIQIEVAGRDDQRTLLRDNIAREGVAHIMSHKGEVENPFQFLRSGDAFLLMSRAEGMPNALLEAMLVGLPCISTRVGDVGEFCKDGEHLRVVDIGDVEGVLGALKEFLANPSAAADLGKRGRQLVRATFSEAAVGNQAVQLLRSIGE